MSECVCDVVEHHGAVAVYPYRCRDCGQCYLCRHTHSRDRTTWTCPTGATKPTTPDAGLAVRPERFDWVAR